MGASLGKEPELLGTDGMVNVKDDALAKRWHVELIHLLLRHLVVGRLERIQREEHNWATRMHTAEHALRWCLQSRYSQARLAQRCAWRVPVTQLKQAGMSRAAAI